MSGLWGPLIQKKTLLHYFNEAFSSVAIFT